MFVVGLCCFFNCILWMPFLHGNMLMQLTFWHSSTSLNSHSHHAQRISTSWWDSCYISVFYIFLYKKKKIRLLCLPSKIFAYHIMISFSLSLYSFAYKLQHYLPWLLCSLFPWKHIPSTSLVLKLLSKELYYEPQYGKFPFLQVCRSKKSVYILCFLESFLYLRTWTVVEK